MLRNMTRNMTRNVTRRQMFAMPAALAVAAEAAAETRRQPVLRIGVCSYTFREFQRKMAIDMIQEMGVSTVSVKDIHLPFWLSPDELRKAVGEFKNAGLTIVSAGNTDLKSENPSRAAPLFRVREDLRHPDAGGRSYACGAAGGREAGEGIRYSGRDSHAWPGGSQFPCAESGDGRDKKHGSAYGDVHRCRPFDAWGRGCGGRNRQRGAETVRLPYEGSQERKREGQPVRRWEKA